MKRFFAAAGAAALVATFAWPALGEEATGVITSVDSTSGSITLSDGKVYFLPKDLADASMLKVGDNVRITFSADSTGKIMASDVKPAGV